MKYIFSAYIIIGILTFGHVASTAQCADYDGKPRVCRTNDQALRGVASWLAWPLYWSWTIQEKF